MAWVFIDVIVAAILLLGIGACGLVIWFLQGIDRALGWLIARLER